MNNRFAQMDCFILAGGPHNPVRDFETVGEITRLENRFRRYASIFEKVWLVLKPNQATGRYLNYPHVCDVDETQSPAVGLMTAFRNSNAEAVFIGSGDAGDFPLELVVNLVNRYNNEMFLGYRFGDEGEAVLGICHRKLADQIAADTAGNDRKLGEILGERGNLLPLPGTGTAD